jgi:hypothetical protein
MIKLIANHPEIIDNESTHLSDAYTTGTTLNVRDSSTLAADDYILLGNLSDEKTEIVKITSITSATAIVVGTPANTHPVDTEIRVIDWNKVEFSYSTDNLAWSVLSTVAIDADENATVYNHAAGTSAYYYRYRYYDEVSAAYSGYSDTVTGGGYASNSLHEMRQMVRDMTNEPNDQFISDAYIDRLLNAAQDEVKNYYKKWRFIEARDTTVQSTVGQDWISLPLDFDHSMYILYNYVDTASDIKYPLMEITWLEMMAKKQETNIEENDNIHFFAIDPITGRIYFEYNGATTWCYFELMYYKKMPTLTDENDTTLVPTPMVLVDYAASYVRATRNPANPVSLSEFRKKLQMMLKHEGRTLSTATGFRQPVSGQGTYFKMGR